MAGDVTVADAIRQLRSQLEKAQLDAEGKALRFWAKTVEVELSITLKDDVEAGAGVKAWFVDLSAKGSQGSETGHKVTLTLEPVGPDGKVLVSGAARNADLDESRGPKPAPQR
jgi:hypothetical protein